MDGLEILEYGGEGYARVVDGPKWTVPRSIMRTGSMKGK